MILCDAAGINRVTWHGWQTVARWQQFMFSICISLTYMYMPYGLVMCGFAYTAAHSSLSAQIYSIIGNACL